MGSIFVSHSKLDTKMINFFTNVTSRLGIMNRFFEWEEPDGQYPATRIADIIRSNHVENVDFVTVLLGPNLTNPPNKLHTHNWVAYEVGVAAGVKKPVLVLEEVDHPSDFPVPYVTDYYLYKLDDNEDRRNIGTLLENLQALARNNVTSLKEFEFTCGHEDCNASYRFWNTDIDEIKCPVCRRTLSISRQ